MEKRARFASHSRHLASKPCNTRKLKITHRGQAGNKIQALREGTCAPSVEQPTQVHNKMKSNRWLDRRDKLTQKGCCSSWDHGLGTPKQSGPARAHGPSHQQGRDINLVYIHPRLRRARSLRGVRRVPAATAALLSRRSACAERLVVTWAAGCPQVLVLVPGGALGPSCRQLQSFYVHVCGQPW